MATYSFTIVSTPGEAARLPTAGLYIDEAREYDLTNHILALNMVPEDGETGVPYDELLRLHVVSIDALVLDPDVKVYITRSSDTTRRLAYDQAGGGFQSPYDGAASVATYQASPSSGVTDELWLKIAHTGDYTSLETVLVEVYANSGGGTHSYSYSYSFVIEDLTAPVIEELLWLSPRKCRIKFDEPLNTLDEPGGSAYVQVDLGSVEILGTAEGADATQVQLASIDPPADCVGYWAQIAGSAFPENNRPRQVTAVDTSLRILTLNTNLGQGGPLKADDGDDYDEQDILVRRRNLKLSISPYYFTFRSSDEGLDYDAISAERDQVAYCPLPVAARIPEASELPADADYRQYVELTLEDDISFGRMYTLHAHGVEDIYENATDDEQFDFQSPTFGMPTDRKVIWSNGLICPPDRQDDLEHNRMLRALTNVLQDAFNMLWYRTDQLKYFDDPSRCPDNWVDFLLYDLGNPFRFPLESVEQKRLLATALPYLYKKVGTAQGIIECLETLLGITFQIHTFVDADYWRLGFSTLGVDTIIGPSSAWAKNAYELVSPVEVTAAQERIAEDVAQWADPCNMHLVRVTTTAVSGGYWILGTSALGITTELGS
jgi:phage tail-like protein